LYWNIGGPAIIAWLIILGKNSHGVNFYKQAVMIISAMLLKWIHPVTTSIILLISHGGEFL